MSIEFQLNARVGTARAGRLITPHGVVETPVFMPVGTAATVKAVPQDVLEELDVQILLGNTYHLYLRPGVETVRQFGGLHEFMAWPRAILTDSGGFQVFSLNELRKVSEEGVTFRSHLDGSSHFFTPESSMAAQIGLGADIVMAFDECTEYPADRARTQSSMELTLRWAERSRRYFEEHKHEVPWRSDASVGRAAPGCPVERSSIGFDCSVNSQGKKSGLRLDGQPRAAVPTGLDPSQALFGIVQGGMYLALRKESAERTVEIGFPGYAIGGLSVGEPRERTREVIEATLEYLPKDKPRYVMGVGTPEEIAEYARLGVDMMDCVLPTRAARHGLLFTSEGCINIKGKKYAEDQSPPDPACDCMVCRRYTRAYLRHLMQAGEALSGTLNTIHNLAYYLGIMQRVRKDLQREG